MALPKTPKITWYTAFAKTITFSGPADFPQPKTEIVGAVAESRSGVRDHWLDNTIYTLSIDARYIPTTADVGSVNAYSSSDGWQDFLAWADKQNQFRYYPDKDAGTYYTCYLISHDDTRDQGGAKYRVKLNMRADAKVTSY